jgi:hypothetical protein
MDWFIMIDFDFKKGRCVNPIIFILTLLLAAGLYAYSFGDKDSADAGEMTASVGGGCLCFASIIFNQILAPTFREELYLRYWKSEVAGAPEIGHREPSKSGDKKDGGHWKDRR